MSYAVEMLNITKEFPGIKANDDITLQVKKGEIHALLGENGAGKSTLMSVLFGLYKPEKGIIKLDGKEVIVKDPNDANKFGIGMVHQHFKLVHNFTVAENIALGVEDTKNGFLDINKTKEKLNNIMDTYGLKIDPDALISDLTVGMQQRVEILKMLYKDSDILIFDEPTAVLTPQEIDQLMNTIKEFAKKGKTIILITHKLDEIMQVSNRCTILRKGKSIDTIEIKNTNKQKLAEIMVGKSVNLMIDKPKANIGENILEVKNLNMTDSRGIQLLKDVSFEAKKGEILTIAGIDGNGQTELVYALSGIVSNYTGQIILDGQDISKSSVRNRTINGIGHIPEDRHKHGLILDFDMANNMMLQTYFDPKYSKFGLFKFKDIYKDAEETMNKFDVRSGKGAYSIARGLSGGNQQKAIAAREIIREPKLLIAVQPTRGLDVGAIEFLHKQLIAHRDAGNTVLLVSLELDEVLNISDRVLVIFEGELVANIKDKDLNRNDLGLYMSGTKRGEI